MSQHDFKLAAPNCGDCPIRHRAVCARCETDELSRLEVMKYYRSFQAGQTVVWSGDRKIGADGKLPAVGNTVDTRTATYRNDIGGSQLAAEWVDPDFDAKVPALYYARVLEIPTPRWTAYDQKRFNIKMDASVPMEVTERAYTSPIWYTPGS